MPHIGRKTLDESWVHWHLLVGAVILLVIVLRFVWRLFHPVALADGLTGWELVAVAHHPSHAVCAGVRDGGVGLGGGQFPRLGRQAVRRDHRCRALAAKGTPWAHEAGDIHDILVYVLLGLHHPASAGRALSLFRQARPGRAAHADGDRTARYPRRPNGRAPRPARPGPDASPPAGGPAAPSGTRSGWPAATWRSPRWRACGRPATGAPTARPALAMTKENSPTGDRNSEACKPVSKFSPASISSSQLRKVLPPVTTTRAAPITQACSIRYCRSINSPTDRKKTNSRMLCTGCGHGQRAAPQGGMAHHQPAQEGAQRRRQAQQARRRGAGKADAQHAQGADIEILEQIFARRESGSS